MKHKHPDKQLLMEYAEGLIDSTARLNPDVASHVSSCDTCRACVDEMRGSFEVIEGVEVIEAGGDLTASILLAARNTPVIPTQNVRRNLFGRVAFAAGLLVLTGITWDMTHQTTAQFVETSYVDEIASVKAEILPVGNLLSSRVEQVLTDAVMGPHRSPGDDWERAQREAVRAYNDDIAEAELALANNPALTRASNMIALSREQKARTLRNVYIESR